MILCWEIIQNLSERLHIHKWSQGFGQTGQVPMHHSWLLPKSVSTCLIGMIDHIILTIVHDKPVRTIVESFAGQGRVVRIHHTMDKANRHPASDKLCRALDVACKSYLHP